MTRSIKVGLKCTRFPLRNNAFKKTTWLNPVSPYVRSPRWCFHYVSNIPGKPLTIEDTVDLPGEEGGSWERAHQTEWQNMLDHDVLGPLIHPPPNTHVLKTGTILWMTCQDGKIVKWKQGLLWLWYGWFGMEWYGWALYWLVAFDLLVSFLLNEEFPSKIFSILWVGDLFLLEKPSSNAYGFPLILVEFVKTIDCSFSRPGNEVHEVLLLGIFFSPNMIEKVTNSISKFVSILGGIPL